MSATEELVVDSHVHFWDRSRFDYAWLESQGAQLRRDFLPVHLAADVDEVDRLRLSGTVFVQADCSSDQSAAEAAWVERLGAAGAPVLAIVAHVALEHGADCAKELDVLAAIPLVTGVRRLLQDEPAEFMTDPLFVEGVRELAAPGFAMDLCIRQHQLQEASRLVELCPDVLFVLDHLGKPVVSGDAFDDWAAGVTRLAAYPTVRCKLSGLASEAPPGSRAPEDLRRWLEHALEVFGPERCMFGSDWPVVTAAASYRQWCDVVLAAIEPLGTAERAAVLSATALEAYDPSRRAARAKDS